jgi:hypothetical protein
MKILVGILQFMDKDTGEIQPPCRATAYYRLNESHTMWLGTKVSPKSKIVQDFKIWAEKNLPQEFLEVKAKFHGERSEEIDELVNFKKASRLIEIDYRNETKGFVKTNEFVGSKFDPDRWVRTVSSGKKPKKRRLVIIDPDTIGQDSKLRKGLEIEDLVNDAVEETSKTLAAAAS